MIRREGLSVALSQDFETFFENHPRPMWVLEPASLAFLAVNQAACALYGYDKTELLLNISFAHFHVSNFLKKWESFICSISVNSKPV